MLATSAPSLLQPLITVVDGLSRYTPALAVIWLVLLFWQRTAQFRTVQIVGALGVLDLVLHGLERAGVAASVSELRVLTTPLEAVLLLSALLLVTVIPFQMLHHVDEGITPVVVQPPATTTAGLETGMYPDWSMVTTHRMPTVATSKRSADARNEAGAVVSDARSGGNYGLDPSTSTTSLSAALAGSLASSGAESGSIEVRARALGLSVIVPVYNERDTIVSIIIRVMEQPMVTEVVIVNDGSTDGTTEVLENMRWPKVVRLYRHEVNQGKGAAIRSGIAAATQGIIIIQDADLEYDPKDYPVVLQPIWEGRADVVYGSRFLTPRPFAFWLDLANRLLTLSTNILYGSRLTDMETCYKAFRSEVLKSVTIVSNRFDFEPEITAKVLRQRRRIVEVPISYERRDFDSGKKIRPADAFAAVRALVRFRFGKV